MSTLSPQLVQDDSSTAMSFHDANLSDPYLCAPVDPDEASFKLSAIRLTPTNGEDHDTTFSTSPALAQPYAEEPESLNDSQEAFYPDFLSPTENFTSDLSVHTSPSADIMSNTLAADGTVEPNAWQHDGIVDRSVWGHVSPVNGVISQINTEPSQIMAVNTRSDQSKDPSDQDQTRLEKTPRTPQSRSLNTNAINDNLSVPVGPDSDRAQSPIVKIESYSRGDSPVRYDSLTERRRSLSFTHLAPNGLTTDLVVNELEETNGGLSPGCSTISRTHNGSWITNTVTGQAGVEPSARVDIYISSPNELEARRRLEEKNADIQSWSASVSAANSDAEDEFTPIRGRKRYLGARRRAKSAGHPSLPQDYFNLKSRFLEPVVPGPGILLHESSDEELSDYRSNDDSNSDSPAVNAYGAVWAGEGLETVPSAEQDRLEDGEPSPHQFLRAPPWQDVDCDSDPQQTRVQPQSSSEAMMEYQRRVKDLDNASRAATWGTRHLNDAEVNGIIGTGGFFENLTISDGKDKKHERKNSLLKYLPRNRSQQLKRRLSELSIIPLSVDTAGKGVELTSPPVRKDHFPNRKLSLGRSKSPSLSTSGAFIAIAGQMAAIGGKDSLRAASPNSTLSPWSNLKGRGRSRSELPRASSPGLIDLMTSHGGPPVPNLAYSTRMIDHSVHLQGASQGHANGDDEDDDRPDVKGLVMHFPVQSRLPVPTLDGFKSQITELNPRLPSALVERFAHEQLRRYRKLVDAKQKHRLDLDAQKCTSGSFCFAQGGQAKLLASCAALHDSDVTNTQSNTSSFDKTGDDTQRLGESAVTAAQFPSGVPLPPVHRLPAEFECPICFQVKKFQKPSDWTKHVHEDVQPFTCTFPHCTEPKSFKRKADWVRHESERHRKLEWWTCTVPDCHHTCYRKDNFVQHLVREHKMPEPKMKKPKSAAPSRKPNDPANLTTDAREDDTRGQEVEQLWELVERCRHDTRRGPKDEPCRFCGNVCSSWKKLTVHLGKHMEQIAMPILGLVTQREVSLNGSVSANSMLDTHAPTSMLIAHAPASFLSQSNAIDTASSDGALSHAQAPGASRIADGQDSVEPTMALSAACSANPPTMSGGWISAEPESMDAHHDLSTSGYLSSLPGETADQSPFMATHQNSVTYPPPFNAGPRVRVVNPEMNVLQDSYVLSMSPTEMQPTFTAQAPMNLSSSGEDRHGLPGFVPPTIPFVAGGYGEGL
ncbi:putative C2H2 finger domain protein [Aspergillus saccharolyticus JOP 1030-1]|uniref:C2H2-type domain-containing protein n=1 Tax=Aspergillus saccharolyticus JOP 1030-1 TaxID=1450539 RepID=A0A318ZQK5_9EURO|nr:hypothetical protein BP01DRAFT_19196 [Aspergillus saccharolyticus JOP 1030-1]PYH46663.1 hypothetical protein BP01DRAFT_19196 [Aspergillus saccharolyticus JOP 1030-1]